MTENQKLRVMCKRDLQTLGKDRNAVLNHKSVPYHIPIIKDGESFITGQQLSYKQMIGEEPLTDKQEEKYPYVINPNNMYKVRHLNWLSRNDPHQNSMIELLLLSGKWAPNKMEYELNTAKYDGYFEDPIAEAVQENNFKDDRYDAETCVRAASMEDYTKIALMVNFLAPNITINVSLRKDLVLKQLYDVCDSNPRIIKNCFAKYNKGVDKDIFILECLYYDILKKADNGDVWYMNEYIGKTLEDVKRFLGKKDNEGLYSKFQALLDQAKGITMTNLQLTEKQTGVPQNIINIMECKSAIFDGDYDRAKLAFRKVNCKENVEECKALSEKLKDMESSREGSKNNVEKKKFLSELQSLDIQRIHEKISMKQSKYKEEDCKDFWTDKEKLISYMADFKFGK